MMEAVGVVGGFQAGAKCPFAVEYPGRGWIIPPAKKKLFSRVSGNKTNPPGVIL